METRKRKSFSLLYEVAILFVLSALLAGVFTFFVQKQHADKNVKAQIERLADQVAAEVKLSVREYPAYNWLFRYWYTYSDTMDIEYDVDYHEGTRTEEKCELLLSHEPGLALKYVDTAQLEAMSPEDQKLYAEIVYSWLITRINQIKRCYQMDYLFCVLTDKTFKGQFFLFSAADPGDVRGTNYEEVYPLGVKVQVSPSQQSAMLGAAQRDASLADAGNYMDYYAMIDAIDGRFVFVGMTYNLTTLKQSILSETLTESTLTMALQFLLSLLCLLLVGLSVLRPLKKVQYSIRQYTQSKDSASVIQSLEKIRIRNEIGQLSEDMISLAREMDEHVSAIRTIAAEKERIGAELALATKIQAAMLPHVFPPFPNRSEFDIYAVMNPAKEVGGDFYDFFLIDDDHLGLLIADVSGKGVPAALFMMASKIILQSCAMLGKSAGEILTKTNEAICSNNPEGMFVTVWLGILEISTGKLSAANAGHEYPVVKMPDGSFTLLKDKHGFVIGGMEGLRYREYELQLEPGSKLFVYTDGVPEATDADNQLFGTQRLLETLHRAEAGSPRQILEAVDQAVTDFVGSAPQFDDLTMLCMHYLGTQSNNTVNSTKELTIEATIENIETVTAFVNEELALLNCPPKAQMQLDVAIDELTANIARYAYDPETGPATVRVDVEQDPLAVVITFIDHGKPYDPLSARAPDITSSAEERPIGGLGVFLVRKTMDDVSYEYKDGQNILRIKKQL